MLNTLQAGRGLAAIAVLLFHAGYAVKYETGLAPFWDVIQFGNRGVDFFFVLSGFIIMRAHETHIGQPGMWRNFVYKRFIRVFPIYWLYTALVAGALLMGLGTYPLPVTSADWLTVFSLLRFTDILTPLPQAWTLYHEVLFYLGFSLLVFSRKLGIAVLASWFLVSIATWEYSLAITEPSALFFNSYNLNFALGIGAYYFTRYVRGAEYLIVTIGLLLVLLAVTVTGPISFLLLSFGFALLIAACASIERTRSLNIPMATLLGNASYSIYLTHEVALAISERIAGIIGIVNPYMLYIFIVPCSLVAGLLAYQVFEKPLLALLRSKPIFQHQQRV